MKLKTNNKFSKWLFKLACKFGYSSLLPEFRPIKNLEVLYMQVKVPEYPESAIDYIEYAKGVICYELTKNAVFKQNIEFTSRFNPVDNTTIICAKLYILNNKGLEDFYERY